MGPLLFLIFINDIDNGLSCSILKFADDTKLFSSVDTLEQVKSLQKDLDTVFSWSQQWQMSFNADKCKCLHLGTSNQNYNYSIGETQVINISQEKDLGVIINESLDASTHCAKVVCTANKILGMLNRTFENKSKSNILRLYKSLVRPHLEYCSQVWRPYHQKDIDNIEKIQRRAT